MKAVLEFNLPEEEHEFRTAVDGHKWQLVVTELDSRLRGRLKYYDASLAEKGLVEARALLHELLQEYNLEGE
jgi:hypothetical protein